MMRLRLNRFAFLIGLAVVACGEDDAPSLTAPPRDASVDRYGSGGDPGKGGSGGTRLDGAPLATGGGDSGVPPEGAAGAGGSGGTQRDAAMENSHGATGGGGGASGAATGGQSGGASTDAGTGGFDGSTGAAIACTSNASCAAGSICVVGHCVEGDCATDSACLSGQI